MARLLATALLAATVAAAEPRDDEVLLIQQRTLGDNLETVETGVVGSLVQQLLMGFGVAQHIQDTLMQLASQPDDSQVELTRQVDALPAPSQGECSAADRHQGNQSVMAFLTRKVTQLPPECPTNVIRLMGSLPTCLHKFLNISQGCAQCHASLIKDLPTCLPGCGELFATCKNKTTSQACWGTVRGCVNCLAPKGAKNMRCTGGYPAEGFKLYDSLVKDVADGRILQKGRLEAAITQVISLAKNYY